MTNPARHLPCAFVLAALLAALGGCSGMNAGSNTSVDAPVSNTPQVMALPNQQSAELSADDIVRVMSRAGFSDDQILNLGTTLRNLLATSGAAQIRIGRKVEAIFSVDSRCLYVTSRQRGSFLYDVQTHAFR